MRDLPPTEIQRGRSPTFQCDAANNLIAWRINNYDGTTYTANYSNTLARYDGYRQSATNGNGDRFYGGTTNQQYDVNGNLTGITDLTLSANNRTIINDVAGRALYVNQGGNVLRQLIANGEVLARFGVGVNDITPKDASGNPNFTNVADFNFGYQPINGNYPSAAPGVYTVRPGDTLDSIARNAFGDGRLWYKIADANGINTSNDIRVGQALIIPNRAAQSGNNAQTFKPYEPLKAIGDTSPNLPQPSGGGGGGGGCGGIGRIILVVVAVVVTAIVTGYIDVSSVASATGTAAGEAAVGGAAAGTGAAGAGAAGAGAAGAGAAAGAAAGTAAAGESLSLAAAFTKGAAAMIGGQVPLGVAAVAAASGSIVSQGVGVVTGIQDKFSWKQVGLSAVSAGVAQTLRPIEFIQGAQIANAAVSAAVANTLTQGIGVITGLQQSFSWRTVAASAAGAAVGSATATALGATNSNTPFTERLAKSTLAGFAGGMTTAVLRGGRIASTQVAIDSFGNAIGNSIVEQAAATATPKPTTAPDATPVYARNATRGVQIASLNVRTSDALTPEEEALMNLRGSNDDPVKAGVTAMDRNGFDVASDSYSVRAGDNLTKIAKRYGLSVGELALMNGLTSSNIVPGQKLTVWGEAVSPAQARAVEAGLLARDNARASTSRAQVGPTVDRARALSGLNPTDELLYRAAARPAYSLNDSGAQGKVLDAVQLGLTGLGLVPVAGAAFDLVNASISVARGDYTGAALNAATAVPFVGLGAVTAKANRALVDVAVKDLALTESQVKNLERFTEKLPSNARENLVLQALPNGGIAAQAISPGRNQGWSAVYEKQIDAAGKTIQYTKTTYDPFKNIVHVKDKITGGVFQ